MAGHRVGAPGETLNLHPDARNGDSMRLNHLDLHVPDVAATRDFFRDHLGFTEIATRGANGLAILHDHNGLELVLSRPVAKFGGAGQRVSTPITLGSSNRRARLWTNCSSNCALQAPKSPANRKPYEAVGCSIATRRGAS